MNLAFWQSMKNKKKRFTHSALLILIAIGSTLGFQNCGNQSGFRSYDSSAASATSKQNSSIPPKTDTTAPASGQVPSQVPPEIPPQVPVPTPPQTPVQAPAPVTEIAPYFYTWGVGKVNSLTEAKKIAGLTSATYAFIISRNGCNLEGSLSDAITDVKNYIASGGNLILGFGGASGPYLEEACTDENQLFNIIDKVIQDTGSKRIDFDVEGQHILDTNANARRSHVLARLQNKYPGLYISLTLATWINGMNTQSLGVINETLAAGVTISRVNIMTMDFGPQSKMLGQLCIQAAQSTLKQLKAIYPNKTDSQIYGMMGITPMIGTNDDDTTFTLNDAEQVARFAKENGVGLLAFWAFQRDQAQTQAGLTPLNSYSGVVQSDFQYYYTLRSIAGTAP